MKVAVWRYGMGFQMEADSKVGGGQLARRVVEEVIAQGHTPVVVGPAGAQTLKWLEDIGVEHNKALVDLRKFGAALIVPGPCNLRFGNVTQTYTRLASLPKDAPAAYCQWDAALPFAWCPEKISGFPKECDVTSKDFARLRLHLLTQQLEVDARATKSVSLAAATAPFKHVRCLFELEEWQPAEALGATVPKHEAIAYFGSDRPGRLRELARWFTPAGAPPVHVYGQWSAKSKERFKSAPNVEFRDGVPEGAVRGLLNTYTATLYAADPLYVKTDFIAQRFFENAMAGTPTIYSDFLQPTIRNAPGVSEFVAWSGIDLNDLFERFRTARRFERAAIVDRQRGVVAAVADQLKDLRLANALRAVLQ